ncbi:MAG: protecting protein DprA [Rhodospirillales bacterium]|nr:protecting protein DprA [Rhodospirillales bacterium]
MAYDLDEAGFVAVSGLARRSDTEAHKAALAYGTIAVVAGGTDIVYLPENATLQSAIFNRGGIVSEAPLGTESLTAFPASQPHHLRNRTGRDRRRRPAQWGR